MSSQLYQQFFLHYFVNDQQHKFSYLQEKLKNFSHPSLDHSKKANQLGFLKNYKTVCNKYLQYVSAEKNQLKFTLNAIMDIIMSVFSQYNIYFQKGGAYRIVFNKRSTNPQTKKLKSYIQELLLVKLCQKFPQQKNHYKSLDKYILSFFFTLNYIKTCNIDVKGFCILLKNDNQEDSYNIQNLFGNFIIRKLGFPLDNDENLSYEQNQAHLHNQLFITIKRFQKILKVLSKDDQLTNMSILTQQNQSSLQINQFSTIKSSQLKQQQQTILSQQRIRCVVALQIYINFLRDNNIKLTQIKIYKLLRLIGLVQAHTIQQEQQRKNPYSNLKGWQEVLSFCLQKNLNHYNNTNNILTNQDGATNTQLLKQQKVSYQKLLLMQICKRNYKISQKLFQNYSNDQSYNRQNSFQSNHSMNKRKSKQQILQNYRQQTYEFILNYLNELFDEKNKSRNGEMRMDYEIVHKLKQIYNYGEIIFKPIIMRVFKHPELHEIYTNYLKG